MKGKTTGIGLLLVAVMLLVTACGGKQPATTPPAAAPVELTVSAAVSMKEALQEAQALYQAKQPNVKITFNLGASGSLQKQIEEGAPVDLFLSAAVKQMDDLEKKGLLKKETRKNLVENQLVLIVGKESKLAVASFNDLTKPEVKQFAMGAPETVPAGQYTQQVLKKLQLTEAVKDRTVLAKDVRTVLAYVETGNAEVGAVYKTDAASSDKVRVVATAPPDTHDPILYPMAVLAASKNVEAATAFAAFLSGPEARTIFEKHGFTAAK
ncbi:MAG TPA: molybdate ABC transporter substrate-binding protein [Patescibacteria group bacterium]|nr:molybdate ABC transporter substrate-binding protein [Patescibacteria group bacterium]